MKEQKTPVCPGCKAEMMGDAWKYEENVYHANYLCGCGWKSPTCSGKTAEEAMRKAAEAANRRPLQKPLTAEELERYFRSVGLDRQTIGRSVFAERRPFGLLYAAVLDAIGDEIIAVWSGSGSHFKQSEYGKTWRAWLTMPTPEEIAAAPWGD